MTQDIEDMIHALEELEQEKSVLVDHQQAAVWGLVIIMAVLSLGHLLA